MNPAMAAAAASENAAGSSGSASGNQPVSILDAEKIFEIAIPYRHGRNGEILAEVGTCPPRLLDVFVPRRRTYATLESLPGYLKKKLPEGAIILSVAFDWYYKYVRVFYMVKVDEPQTVAESRNP